MGIDVYLEWDNQTEAEGAAQITGFRNDMGRVGYLREAYHGGPYATHVLFTESWEEAEEDGLVIPNKVLRSRLPATLAAVILRARKVYDHHLTEESPECMAFRDFIDLHEKLEKAGVHPRIVISY